MNLMKMGKNRTRTSSGCGPRFREAHAKSIRILLILIGISFLFTGTVSAGQSTNESVSFAGEWITIDHLPIGEHETGKSFTVSGQTDLPAGTTIEYGIYSSVFAPGAPGLLPPHFAGSIRVINGSGRNNIWSFVVDTTQFEKMLENGTIIHEKAAAGDYTLSLRVPGNDRVYSVPLTIRESPTRPAENSSGIPEPAITPVSLASSPGNSLIRSSSIPVAGIVIALGAFFLLRKKSR